MNIDPQKTAQVVNTLDDYINQDITAIANDNTFDFMKTWLTNKLVQLQGEKIVWLRKNQYFPASDSAFGDQWYAYAKSTEQEITSTWNIGGIPSVDMILGRGGGLTVSVDQAAINNPTPLTNAATGVKQFTHSVTDVATNAAAAIKKEVNALPGQIAAIPAAIGKGAGSLLEGALGGIPWYILVGIAGVVIVVGVVAIKRR